MNGYIDRESTLIYFWIINPEFGLGISGTHRRPS
jgi:hypothetical protein